MAGYQHPPTYAEFTLKDPVTGDISFNPVWLKWFMDMANFSAVSTGPFAQLAGLSTQAFSVAAATAAAHAVRLDQVGRRLGQVVTYQTGANATGTTVIPLDTSIPQNTEGTEFMTLAITPASATSTLEIEVVFQSSLNIVHDVIVALFQDSTANALAAVNASNYVNGATENIKFTHLMTSGTTSATTLKVRAGPGSAGTLSFNPGSYFGGLTASRITIKEWLP